MGSGSSVQKNTPTNNNMDDKMSVANGKQDSNQNKDDNIEPIITVSDTSTNEKEAVSEKTTVGNKLVNNIAIKLHELTLPILKNEVDTTLQELFDQSKTALTVAVSFLKDTNDYVDEKVFSCMEICKKNYSDTRLKLHRHMFAQHLCSHGFVDVFCKFWTELHKLDLFNPENMLALNTLQMMKVTAWNFTNVSIQMCSEMGEAGTIPLLLSTLNQKELLPALLTNELLIHVKASLGILNNMVRLCPANRKRMRDHGAVKLLLDYVSVRFVLLKANCFFILSFLITDDEVDLLENSGTAIRFIMDLLTTSLTSRIGVARGYGTAEILLGLNNLALNDSNKVKIVTFNGLPQLAKALAMKGKEAVCILAAELVWKLAFIEENKQKIKDEKDLVDALKVFINSENPKLKAACAGALWEVCGGKSAESDGVTSVVQQKVNQPHVMLSYQWDVQARMILLKERLQNAGYNVWMDIDQMEGDILGAMATAVENSAIILSCVSQKYKDSTSCRTEATYAYKKNKPIIPLIVQPNYIADGWLGALIGTFKYFSLFKDSMVATEFLNIINEIGERGKTQVEHKDVLAMSVAPVGSANIIGVDCVDSSPKTTPDISVWTPNDVKKWLKEIDMDECSTAMKDVDGPILIYMYKMSNQAPDYFYSRLERDFNMEHLMQVLKFSSSLEKLLTM